MKNLIDEEPANGEKRFWAFASYFPTRPESDNIFILQVKVKESVYDEDNADYYYDCEVIKVIEDNMGVYFPGREVMIDFAWQLQKTEEQARLLLIHTVLTEGPEAFFYADAPF